jgi:hypothetical protein
MFRIALKMILADRAKFLVCCSALLYPVPGYLRRVLLLAAS